MKPPQRLIDPAGSRGNLVEEAGYVEAIGRHLTDGLAATGEEPPELADGRRAGEAAAHANHRDGLGATGLQVRTRGPRGVIHCGSWRPAAGSAGARKWTGRRSVHCVRMYSRHAASAPVIPASCHPGGFGSADDSSAYLSGDVDDHAKFHAPGFWPQPIRHAQSLSAGAVASTVETSAASAVSTSAAALWRKK